MFADVTPDDLPTKSHHRIYFHGCTLSRKAAVFPRFGKIRAAGKRCLRVPKCERIELEPWPPMGQKRPGGALWLQGGRGHPREPILRLRRIWTAARPAPKPLSMLTTVSPPAQEVSIPNSAVNPPRAAP